MKRSFFIADSVSADSAVALSAPSWNEGVSTIAGSTAATPTTSRKSAWPYLCTSLEKSGLLYCNGTTSLQSGYDAVDVVTMLSSGGVVKAGVTLAPSTPSSQPLDFDGKLEQLEKAEQQHVDLLLHLRDYYMLPILGTPSPSEAWHRATGTTTTQASGRDSRIGRYASKTPRNRHARRKHNTSGAKTANLQAS
ncbi:hypothetical protein THASP1DRAFT_25074 [Thamnocephalis sphaerospora]|uniref:Uncharacterized protein n=1 Tax=Thamnocephalis sphaerospora TaxID=78915 RepID=A0A4P9XLH2_9FUNG|nr:hypothetical protein THASP1DRAFT_25074 [Thamnocephalis sphaerospora]|eukprot:RKP06652.1 hypothetical protein THASP1DRAFT_25074 [Thamnocephalis sphaerospora]